MPSVFLTPQVSVDMFALKVLLRVLKKTLAVDVMFIHDLLALAAGDGAKPLVGTIMRTVSHLQDTYVIECTNSGIEEPELLTKPNGTLSLQFRTVLLCCVSGSFPNYEIRPPTRHAARE